jgi:hypothetical protein
LKKRLAGADLLMLLLDAGGQAGDEAHPEKVLPHTRVDYYSCARDLDAAPS